MSGILRLESLTKGNTLKQGDKTPLKYRLFDADGEQLNIAGKSAKVRLVHPDFLTIGYEKDGLTVAQDDTVTFTIDRVIPSRIYHVEIIVDDQFIFPSRADESKFTVDKSSLGAETNIIEIVGKDVLIQEVKSQVDTQLQPLVTSMESAQLAEAQRLLAEQERSEKYGSYAQQFNDVILELSEEKDYHSLPEIAGARGGHETLGNRLDETDAQLAQTDVTHHQAEAVKSLPVGSKGGSVKDFEYKGQTLVNLVENGDFSDGLTGWVLWGNAQLDNPVYSLVNNNIVLSSDASGNGRISKDINCSMHDILYVNIPMSGTGKIVLWKSDYGSWNNLQVADSATTTSLSTIIDDLGVDNVRLGIGYTNDGVYVNRTIYNMQIINLTQLFGAGNEPTKEEMDAMIDGYIDGMQSAKADVKTVGKNLFDVDREIKYGFFSSVDNSEIINSERVASVIADSNGITYELRGGGFAGFIMGSYKVKRNTNYVISYDSTDNDIGIMYAVKVGEDRYSRLASGRVFNSGEHTEVFINVFYNSPTSSKTVTVSNIQLEEGITATEYEPYKSSTITLTEEPTLHRLPNGVADRVFEQDGQLWLEKRVGEYVFDGSYSWDMDSGMTNTVRFFSYIGLPAVQNDEPNTILLIDGDFIKHDLQTSADYSDEEKQSYTTSNAFFRVRVNKSRLSAVSANGFNQFLDEGNVILYYQLAEPELINLTEQGLVTGELMSYANGTSYNNGSIKGEVSFKVPTSTGAQITSLVDSSERQAKQIAILSDHVAQLISGV